jgi:rhamnopyranosyl-N-acetylglucosaminyl-diphospho-decaprenol beta-1,3/1,4-galactofuranosyltransferase
LPKPELFVWGDESEYYCRIIKTNKIPVYTVTDSIHYHPAAVFTLKKDWDYKNTWKMFYYIRNRFIINQSKFNNKILAFLNYCCFLVAMAVLVMIYQKTDKIKKLGFIFWPAADAFSNNYNATPHMILSRLGSNTITNFRNSVTNYVRNISATLFESFGLSGSRGEINV